MQIKIKKLNDKAVIPTRGTNGSAGLDLTAVSREYKHGFIEYDTGLAIELPKNHVGLIFPRSSISNTTLTLCNSVGVLDCDYQGSIKFRFRQTEENQFKQVNYKPGDRIGQLIVIPYPDLEILQVEEFSIKTERGSGGYGSTGK